MATFRTLLHAQQHCLVEKHWMGHEEVPVPACHQPALWPWTSHMVFLSLLPMKGLDWTPSVSFTNTNIMSLWGEGGWWMSPQTVQGKYSWPMILMTTLFFCRRTWNHKSLSPARTMRSKQTCNSSTHSKHMQKEPDRTGSCRETTDLPGHTPTPPSSLPFPLSWRKKANQCALKCKEKCEHFMNVPVPVYENVWYLLLRAALLFVLLWWLPKWGCLQPKYVTAFLCKYGSFQKWPREQLLSHWLIFP